MCGSCIQSGLSVAESVGLEPSTTKALSIATAAVMLFSLSSPFVPASTSVRAGAVCIKANQKVVKSGKTFVCKRSGEKFVWRVQKKKVTVPATQPEPPARPPTRVSFSEKGETANLSTCRLADARNPKIQPNNVGFPLQPDLIPVTGTANIIVIPVDFSDLPANSDPSSYLKQQTQIMADWYDYFSNGQFKLTFQIGSKWIRPQKPNSAYTVRKDVAGGSGVDTDVQTQMAQDIINASGDEFDFTKSNSVFFYMPTNKAVDYDLGARGTWLTTKAGTKGFFFWGGGAYHFDDRGVRSEIKRNKMWAFWIHEMLHSQGLALHSPGNGFETTIATDQYGKSLVLSAWELFRLDWIKEPNIICIDASKLLDHGVTLKPVELGSAGMKVAVVRLNQYEALVIESRRPTGYSADWEQDQRGLLIYQVDVRRDNDRFNESTGKDLGNDPNYSKWGYYLAPDGKTITGSGGLTYGQYILKPNDSVTFGGVKIKLINSYENDDIEITKVN